MPDHRPTPSKETRSGISRAVRRRFAAFFHVESIGGLLLLTAAILALIVANSPVGDSVEAFWSKDLPSDLGPLRLPTNLRAWVNDGLMAIFFLVVGLEIKLELTGGELNTPRKAAFPVTAALGGMLAPALIYLALNPSGISSRGWGVPMATDIAFATGVLAMIGRRVPTSLKVFLLTLAIVDDVGAILVIALFYSEGLRVSWLVAAVMIATALAALRYLGVKHAPIYLAVGSALWLATFQTGIHATVAGVTLGLLMPAGAGTKRDPSLAQRLQTALHPWSSYLIVPVFALVNAGLALDLDRIFGPGSTRVAAGIGLGLVFGKLVGITAAAWAATKLGIASMPDQTSWRHIIGAAALGGIGFTVSIFIAGLAFSEPHLLMSAKAGVFAGSVAAGLLGVMVLRGVRPVHR